SPYRRRCKPRRRTGRWLWRGATCRPGAANQHGIALLEDEAALARLRGIARTIALAAPTTPPLQQHGVRLSLSLREPRARSLKGQIPPSDLEGLPTALGSIAEIQTEDTDKKSGGLNRRSR